MVTTPEIPPGEYVPPVSWQGFSSLKISTGRTNERTDGSDSFECERKKFFFIIIIIVDYVLEREQHLRLWFLFELGSLLR